MKTNKLIYFLLAGLLVAGLSSCNDFLDEQPDNRTIIDSEEKAIKMLVSAYADSQPWLFLEMASDNTDNHGANYDGWSRFWQESYEWSDPTETDNEDAAHTWEAHYMAIANANEVLKAIDKMEMTDKLSAAKGEALICRAYAHFVLVNVFCQHYDPAHPDDLGIPYMEKAETELDPKYERGTVAEVYAKIEKDIEEGLPLINDVIYSVPKYHFNKRAANAFAARFYLYYQKWDEAVKYATVALTNSPAGSLRNYEELLEYPMNNGATLNTAATYYVSADLTCNFMMATAYSYAGRVFGGYGVGMQYNHGQMIADNEGIDCTNTPFAPYTWKCEPLRFVSGIDKILLPRVPYLIEDLDPVAGTGYRHTVYPLFTAEETLLTRAEAYIMQKDYTAALSDMNLYLSNSCSKYKTLTEANISSWAASVADYDPKNPTPKKPLNPAFEIDQTQEGMIHTLLLLRRYETLHYGLRWFDVKRFGIEIYRRTLTSNDLVIKSVDDTLEVRDNRRAVQLPADVLAADMTPNPR